MLLPPPAVCLLGSSTGRHRRRLACLAAEGAESKSFFSLMRAFSSFLASDASSSGGSITSTSGGICPLSTCEAGARAPEAAKWGHTGHDGRAKRASGRAACGRHLRTVHSAQRTAQRASHLPSQVRICGVLQVEVQVAELGLVRLHSAQRRARARWPAVPLSSRGRCAGLALANGAGTLAVAVQTWPWAAEPAPLPPLVPQRSGRSAWLWHAAAASRCQARAGGRAGWAEMVCAAAAPHL